MPNENTLVTLMVMVVTDDVYTADSGVVVLVHCTNSRIQRSGSTELIVTSALILGILQALVLISTTVAESPNSHDVLLCDGDVRGMPWRNYD